MQYDTVMLLSSLQQERFVNFCFQVNKNEEKQL